MEKVLKLYKEIGETPLECLERFRDANPEYKGVPMTYAGRLDPMAEGILLVLVGEECKQKEKYLAYDKEYEVEILLGFATDSYDILGKVTDSLGGSTSKSFPDLFLILQSFVGKFTQEYPRYSSRLIPKVSHLAIARNRTLDNWPTKDVEIYSVDYLDMYEMEALELLADTQTRIAKVKGDFRQKETLDLWRENLGMSDVPKIYQILKIKVSCSSGTYMRSLAHNLGQKLGMSALAYSIKRTKVGSFEI
ncbi:MAG: hypothetical protein V4438_01310 [Patescibacteria group bacterium]